MNLSFRSFLSLFACLMLVGLSLASCGGTAASSPTSSADSMTLRVGQITSDVSFFPFTIALQQNYFKEQGLTLTPTPIPFMGSGSKLATALEAGSFDIAVGTVSDAFTVSRVDARIKIVGSLSNDFLLNLVMTKSFQQEAHLTENSPLTDKVKALVGKKVGITAPNSSTDALLTYLFRQQGLNDQKDVTKVSLGGDTHTIIAALKSGRVDAAIFGLPAAALAHVQGIADTIISPVHGDVPTMQGQLFGVLYTKQTIIDAKPKAVQAFIRAIAQADTYIQKNPDLVTSYVSKYFNIDQKSAQVTWDTTKPSMPMSPQVSQQAYDTANHFQVKAGLIAVPLAYNDLVATDTINKALSGLSS